VLRALGLPVRSPGEKVEALDEAIEILRGLWSEETFSYQGRRYRTEEARIEPKASRRIPIWLGTYGPKGLDLTGRLADGWTPSLPYAPLPQAVKMRERVLQAAAAAGRPPDTVVCNLNFGVLVDGGSARREGVVVGSAGEVAERMVEFVRAGFTSLDLWPLREDREQIERLAGEVLPAVRSAVQADDVATSTRR
jgi:alkanesulfonate monooxygenase SsuD/methylene tetrahydromethanopterin reductase-like flavin-dependent oxidoreductase (luciferase family)